jgi:hypothetical protein
MTPEDGTSELELIAKAFQEISKEISHEGLAKALLKAALGYSRAAIHSPRPMRAFLAKE